MEYFSKKIDEQRKKMYILIIVIFIMFNLILFLYYFLIQLKMQNTTKDDIVINEKNNNIVFLGDSITAQYPISRLLDDFVIVNSGKGGMSSGEILENLTSLVYIYNPTKVFLLIGVNDIERGTPEEEIISNIEKIMQKIKKNQPQTTIYIQSIYPVNNTNNSQVNNQIVSKRNNETIDRINQQLKILCQKHSIRYIDIYNALLDDNGQLDLEYTTDGLHISVLGYSKITNIIYNYL